MFESWNVFGRLANLESWVGHLAGKVNGMIAELEALKAAVAADDAADARLVAYLEALKVSLDDMTAKLNEMQAREVIDPADIQAIADQLSAHAADVATHLPADTSGAA